MRFAETSLLVVDHDPAARGLIVRTLGAEGFMVVAAGDDLAALRAVRQARFGLIILALGRAGGPGGRSALRDARTRQPGLKALFTGERPPPPGDAPELEDFLSKPFERWELLGCVLELLQRDTSPGADLWRRCRAGSRTF